MAWANITEFVLGIWLIISPWVLGFSEIIPALWSCTISGILLGLTAFWELFGNEPQEESRANGPREEV